MKCIVCNQASDDVDEVDIFEPGVKGSSWGVCGKMIWCGVQTRLCPIDPFFLGLDQLWLGYVHRKD